MQSFDISVVNAVAAIMGSDVIAQNTHQGCKQAQIGGSQGLYNPPIGHDLDFSKESIPMEVIEVAIHAVLPDATTPEESSPGHFTCFKLKPLSTFDEWQAGERKQLDQFNGQRLYGDHANTPPNVIVLCLHWQ